MTETIFTSASDIKATSALKPQELQKVKFNIEQRMKVVEKKIATTTATEAPTQGIKITYSFTFIEQMNEMKRITALMEEWKKDPALQARISTLDDGACVH